MKDEIWMVYWMIRIGNPQFKNLDQYDSFNYIILIKQISQQAIQIFFF